MTNRWVSLPHPTQPNQVGGHEGIGKVVKLGPGAENSNVKVGDRVGIKWLSGICGNCAPCLSGHDGTLFHRARDVLVRRVLTARHNRTMFQPKGLRLLHPRHFPAIRTRTRYGPPTFALPSSMPRLTESSSKLRHPSARKPRQRRSSANALRWRNSVQCPAKVRRKERRLGRAPRRWWRSKQIIASQMLDQTADTTRTSSATSPFKSLLAAWACG